MISVVLLAYKEADNLKVLFPKIKEVMNLLGEDYILKIIDTKEAQDNTREICEEAGAEYYNQEEPGFGGAYRKGIEVASGDKMIVLDSDGSHDPKYLLDMYKLYSSNNYQVVIGSRYIKGGITYDKKSSQIMSAILNGVFRLFLGLKAKDLSTNYRIYNLELLKKCQLKCVNYDILEEILLSMKMLSPKGTFKIGETPITFKKRIYGESKRRLIPFIISYIKSLIRLTIKRISGKA